MVRFIQILRYDVRSYMCVCAHTAQWCRGINVSLSIWLISLPVSKCVLARQAYVANACLCACARVSVRAPSVQPSGLLTRAEMDRTVGT